MIHFFLPLLSGLSGTAAHATIELPKISANQEHCFVRVYTNDEIAADGKIAYAGQKQRVRGVALSIRKGESADSVLIVRLMIRTLDGRSFSNSGIFVSARGTTVTQLSGRRVSAAMDVIDGNFQVEQSQFRRDRIFVQVQDAVKLVAVDAGFEASESTQEIPPIQIAGEDSDARLRLERVRSAGSARSCEEHLEAALSAGGE
jgi:hypothetical protein